MRNESFVDSIVGDLRSLFDLLYGHKYLLVICGAVAGLLGWWHAARTPNLYAATAVLEVEQEQPGSLNLEQKKLEERSGLEALKTIESNLTSPSLLLRVIYKNDLLKDPGFLPELKRPVSEQRAQSALASHVSAQLRTGTRLIDVSVEDRNPVMAQHLADLLVREFIDLNREVRMQSANEASDFLVREASRLRGKLSRSEQALQAYKEQHHAVSLEEKQNIVVEKLRELNTRVTLAKAERLKLETDQAQIQKLAGETPERLLEVSSVSSLPAVAELKRKIEEQSSLVAMQAERYKPSHPKQLAARSALDALKESLRATLRKAGDMVNSAYEAALATESKLQQALADQERSALELNKLSVEFNPLVRDVDTDRALFESVSKRLKEAQVSAQNTESGIHIASSPLLPERPIKPRRKLIVLASILAGILVGVGVSVAGAVTDRSFKKVEQTEQRLGLRALGAIPKAQSFGRGSGKSLRQVVSDPITAEAFKSLRTTLNLLCKNPGPHCLLMASAEPGEGKTFCAINAAVAFAQTGLKTLLVDADLRTAGIGAHFKKAAPLAPGLSDYLTGHASFEEVIQPTECKQMYLAGAGRQCESPSELLAQESLSRFLEKAGKLYERIVIDIPALEAVSDGLQLVAHAQAVCLVIQAGKTSEHFVVAAINKLKAAGVAPIGFILNGALVERKHRGYYTSRPVVLEESTR